MTTPPTTPATTPATTPVEKLIGMGNQMADFFRAYPEAEAIAGIREHIQSFWTPRMRAEIRAQGGHPGLDPLLAAALRTAPQAESPIKKQTAGPNEAGLLASDAG